MPVADPFDLDTDRVAALLRSRHVSADIAAELGITIDHIRLVIRHTPGLLVPNVKPSGADPKRAARTAPPAGLTTDRLRHLVVNERRTLRSLAEEFGVDRKFLVQWLRREDIPVPPSGRRSRYDPGPATPPI